MLECMAWTRARLSCEREPGCKRRGVYSLRFYTCMLVLGCLFNAHCSNMLLRISAEQKAVGLDVRGPDARTSLLQCNIMACTLPSTC